MRWLALALGLLLAAPAAADMYQDGSNAKLPEARTHLGIVTGCDPVAEFGADPTGVADATAAINACAAQTQNGYRSNVSLPAGTFRVNGPINLDSGQSITGAGRATTVLAVDQSFSSAASGVIVLAAGDKVLGPEVRDIGIAFAQPDDQASRANFQNLGTCTSGMGGTGCKYPPAIKMTGASYYPKVRQVRISKAWIGISSVGGQIAPWVDNVEISALDTGMEIGESYGFSHYKGFVFWNYEFNSETPLYLGVFTDGVPVAARFGNVNGFNVADFTTLHGHIVIDGALAWGDITNLQMDFGPTRLEITTNKWPGVRIANMYSTGDAGAGAPGVGCKVKIGAGNQSTQIINWFGDGSTNSMLCVAGGDVLVGNSVLLSNTPAQKPVVVTGGRLSFKNNTFLANTGLPYPEPLIDVQGGIIDAVGNTFPGASTNVGSIKIAVDSAEHYIADNNTRLWPVVRNFSTVQGYYDLGDQVVTIPNITGILPSFPTPGNSVFTVAASGGGYFLRGNFVEGGADMMFATNAYTTASGTFQVQVPGMPPPAGGVSEGCSVHLVDNLTLTSAPTCNVGTVGTSGGFYFAKVNSGAPATFMATAEVPASRANMALRLGWRYRIR